MNQDFSIRRYVNALMRGWWVILLVGIITGVVTYIITPKVPPSYESSASLTFEDPAQQSSVTPLFTTNFLPPRSLATQIQYIKSPQVLRRAALKILDDGSGESPGINRVNREVEALQVNVSTRQLRNTTVVEITARAPEPNVAVKRANAVAEAYIEQVSEDLATELSARLDSITRQIDSLQVARDQAYTVDPQSVADLESQVASAEIAITAVLDSLESLQESGQVTRISVDRLVQMSDQLAIVTNDLTGVQEQLIAVRDRKLEASGSVAASQLTTDLLLAADSLDRGAAQLGETLDGAGGSLIAGVASLEDSIVTASDSLELAAVSLDQVEEAPGSQTSKAQMAADSLTAAANAMNSSASRVGEVLRTPGLGVNQPQLQVTRDRLAILEADIRKILPSVSRLSEGSAASSEAEQRQLILNQIRVLQTSIGVVIPDLRLLRSQETNSLNIGRLFTAEDQAQLGSNSLTDAVTHVQAIGQPSAIGQVSITEMKVEFVTLSEDIASLTGEVAEVADSDPVDEQRLLGLVGEATALHASLDTLVLQLQSRRTTETDPDKFVPLFVAEQHAKSGLDAVSDLLSGLNAIGGPPGASSGPVSLEDIRVQMTILAAGLRDIVSEYGGALAGGALDEGAYTLLSDALSVHNASLDLLVQQLQPLRISQTDPQIYGSMRTAEDRAREALQHMASASNQVNQVGGTSASSVSAALLDSLQSRTAEIASTIRTTKLDLDGFINNLEANPTADMSGLASMQDRITASRDILVTVVSEVGQIRSQETDITNHSRLLAIERELLASSTVLLDSSSGIDQLRIRPGAAVSQSLDRAAAEGIKARDTLDRAVQRMAALTNDMEAGLTVSPSSLAVLGQDFTSVAGNLEAASLALQEADQLEKLLTVKTEIISVIGAVSTSQISAADTAAQLEQLSQPSATLSSLYSQLLDTQSQLQLSRLLFREDVRLTNPPIVAQRVTDSALLYNTAVGSVAGLLLGVLIILSQEFVDRRLRIQDDVKRQLEIPSLGAVPKATGSWNPHPQILPDTPPTLFSEAVRMVRTAVEVGRQNRAARILLITSPREREGKTTIALNLARSMAMERRRVLLIDGNLREPEVGDAFKLSGGAGLGTALQSGRDPSEFITESDGVHVLPAGQAMTNPADILMSPAFREFLDRSKAEYDIILIDSPPIIGYADAIVLAKNSDGVILTLRADYSTVSKATEAKELLQSAGVPVFGAVLNMSSRRNSGVAAPTSGTGLAGRLALWQRFKK